MSGLTIRNDAETDIVSGVVGDPVKCSLHCIGEKLRHSTLILNFNTYSPSCSGIKKLLYTHNIGSGKNHRCTRLWAHFHESKNHRCPGLYAHFIMKAKTSAKL